MVYNLVKSAKTLQEALDLKYKIKVGTDEFKVDKFLDLRWSIQEQ